MREKAPRDVVIAKFRRHGRALFWPTALLVAVAGTFGYFAGRFDEEWQNWAVLAAALILVVVGWFVPVVRWLSTRYVVTNRRVIVRQGGVRRELLHGRNYDITVRQRGMQRLFGTGDVTISAALDSPVVLRDVPSATLVQEALNELREANPPQTVLGASFEAE
jgi:membrane protein YdbS with pleckstrin-like domain